MKLILLTCYFFSSFWISGFIVYRFFLSLRGPKRMPDPLTSKAISRFPDVCVQLPLYNEPHVAERLLNAVVALDWPKEHLFIQVLDDSTDETTALVEKFRFDHPTANLSHIRRPHRQGFKAGALKEGLALTDAPYLAILDADFIPAPNFLKALLPHLIENKNCFAIQARWTYLNPTFSILTRAQTLMLEAHQNVEHLSRQTLGAFIHFNGTAGILRRSSILQAGNWQSDTLTEDLDLSFRAQMQGFEIMYDPTHTASSELPSLIHAVKTQHARWAKGASQTLRKLFQKLIFSKTLSVSKKFHAILHLLSNTTYVFVFCYVVLLGPVVAIDPFAHLQSTELHLLSLILFSGLSYVYFYISSKLTRHSQLETLKAFFYMISLNVWLASHNALAVVRGYTKPTDPFIRTFKSGFQPHLPREKINFWTSTLFDMALLLFLALWIPTTFEKKQWVSGSLQGVCFLSIALWSLKYTLECLKINSAHVTPKLKIMDPLEAFHTPVLEKVSKTS